MPPGWHPPLVPPGSTGGVQLPAEYQAIIDALNAQAAAGSTPAFNTTSAGIAQQAADDRALATLQAQLGSEEGAREFERQKELQRMQQAYEAEQKKAQMLQERQSEFANLIGKGDSVRAVLLGLGIGGNLNPGAGRYEGLPALEGAGEFQQKTQQALSGLQQQATGAPANVTIGDQGVSGLGSVEQFARASQRGGEGVNQLLTSAFGVGNQGLGGGVSQEEYQRRIQDVTPTGILR